MGRMTDRDRRDQSFARARGHFAVCFDPVPAGRPCFKCGALPGACRCVEEDARETAAAAGQWIVMGQFDGIYNFFRGRNGRGFNVWTLDDRAAASVRSFESELEAGQFIAATFSEREINQFTIQPTAFYGGGRNGW